MTSSNFDDKIELTNLRLFLTRPGTDKFRFLLETLEAADAKGSRLFAQLSKLRETAKVPFNLRTQIMGAIDPQMLVQLSQTLQASDNPILNNYAPILRAKAALENDILDALSSL